MAQVSITVAAPCGSVLHCSSNLRNCRRSEKRLENKEWDQKRTRLCQWSMHTANTGEQAFYTHSQMHFLCRIRNVGFERNAQSPFKRWVGWRTCFDQGVTVDNIVRPQKTMCKPLFSPSCVWLPCDVILPSFCSHIYSSSGVVIYAPHACPAQRGSPGRTNPHRRV